MTVLILLTIAAALGLAFAAYKHPAAYRVIFIFAIPVLVMGGFVVLLIKVGDLNASVKSISNELQHIEKNAVSDQLSYPIRRLNADRQFLKLFFIYYVSGFTYLVFLMLLPNLLNLAKGRQRHTDTQTISGNGG
jgi:MFS family permease